MTSPSEQPPPRVEEFAAQTVEYVRRAVGVALTFDSDTLPLLDHYLGTVPADRPDLIELVVATAGAYFGEVVRRHLGGRWEGLDEKPPAWRMVLPTGVSFSPAGFVAAAITRAELDDHETGFEAPPRMKPHLAEALARMGELTEDDYYSLSGRFDTLEHVHSVLLGVAARLLGDAVDDDGEDGDAEPEGPDADDPPDAPN